MVVIVAKYYTYSQKAYKPWMRAKKIRGAVKRGLEPKENKMCR